MKAANIPADPRERSIWIQAQLKLLGSSFAAVGRKAGLGRYSISRCVLVPHHSAELALAAELGIPLKTLFPERYDRRGKRLHAIRGPKSSDTPNTRNVEDREAA